jgi:hypothetical protein
MVGSGFASKTVPATLCCKALGRRGDRVRRAVLLVQDGFSSLLAPLETTSLEEWRHWEPASSVEPWLSVSLETLLGTQGAPLSTVMVSEPRLRSRFVCKRHWPKSSHQFNCLPQSPGLTSEGASACAPHMAPLDRSCFAREGHHEACSKRFVTSLSLQGWIVDDVQSHARPETAPRRSIETQSSLMDCLPSAGFKTFWFRYPI